MDGLRKTSCLLPVLLVALVTCASLFGGLPKTSAQTGTNVIGLISSDTTWAQTGSPYTFTGNVAVNQGVTMTVEAGTIVNLNNYYLRVNGTLTAVGASNEKITFNGGQIIFTTVSNGWNQQTNSGCIIENSFINQTYVSASNPIKIDNCVINGKITVTSSIISENQVTGDINSYSAIPTIGQGYTAVDSSAITDNIVTGDIILGQVFLGAVTAPSEACIVSNNTVDGSIITGSPQGTPQIFDNTVTKGGIECDGYASIFDNYVYGCQAGVNLYTLRVFGGNLPCYASVENNVIADNSQGISISLTDVHGGLGQQYCPTILNNTISGNPIGISLSGFGYNAAPTIEYNNLQSSSNYTFFLQESNNVDLSYNWWGTTDQQAINQSIYDFKDDFNQGTVTFLPILTAPNPQAPTVINPAATSQPSPTPTATPTPIPTTSTTSTPTPTQQHAVPELPALAILPLLLSTLSAALMLRHRKTEHSSTAYLSQNSRVRKY